MKTMRILLAIDESESSRRAVEYVGSLLGQTPNVQITLFHVLKPMPRQLLEHGGSENPAAETRLRKQLHEDQEAWYRKEREAECPVLITARAILEKSGFDTGRLSLKFGHEDDVARNILEEARNGHYTTIVVGRQGASGMTRMFGGGVTEHLLRNVKGLAIWVVE
jgi:nucleotide-binding universal stress UspA family protein